MNVFDIVGPVMIGPSSSHTVGAARIAHRTGAFGCSGRDGGHSFARQFCQDIPGPRDG